MDGVRVGMFGFQVGRSVLKLGSLRKTRTRALAHAQHFSKRLLSPLTGGFIACPKNRPARVTADSTNTQPLTPVALTNTDCHRLEGYAGIP